MADGTRTQLPAVAPGKVELDLGQQLVIAEQREEALRLVLRALISSIRPFGFNRDKFKRCVREEGEDTPDTGPRSARHAVLHAEVRRVLREAR